MSGLPTPAQPPEPRDPRRTLCARSSRSRRRIDAGLFAAADWCRMRSSSASSSVLSAGVDRGHARLASPGSDAADPIDLCRGRQGQRQAGRWGSSMMRIDAAERRHRDRLRLLGSGDVAHCASPPRRSISCPLRARRSRLSPLRMEVQQRQRAEQGGSQALRLHLRGRSSAST